MRNQRVVLMAAVAIIATVAVFFLLRRPSVPPPAKAPKLAPVVAPSPPPTPVVPETLAPVPPAEVVAPVPEATAVVTGPRLETIVLEEGAAPIQVVRVQANQVLATVNLMPIMLKDLVALEPGQTEQTMTPEEYNSRLHRAIDMEVTAQAARSRGVSLTEEQQAELRRMQEKRAAELQEQKEQGMKYTSFRPEDVQFEQRILRTIMLQQNLLAQIGGPSPLDHAAYSDALRKLVDDLVASATITVASPTP